MNQVIRYFFFSIWACVLALIVFWMISQMWVGKDQRTLLEEMQTHVGDVPKTNEFTTLFDYTAGSIRAHALFYFAVGLVLIVGGIVGYIRHRRILKKRLKYLVMVYPGLFLWVLHLGLFDLAISDIKGNTRIAEGVVHVSFVQGYHGHSAGDQITVGGQPFDVDHFRVTPGYDQTIARGGALREGVYARLHHYNGVITKVEVKGKQTDQPTSLTNKIIWGLASTILLLLLGAIAYIGFCWARGTPRSGL